MTKIWPDDYSEDELVAEAVDEVVEGVLEGASFNFCVEYAHKGFGRDLSHRKSEIRERARQRLEGRDVL